MDVKGVLQGMQIGAQGATPVMMIKENPPKQKYKASRQPASETKLAG